MKRLSIAVAVTLLILIGTGLSIANKQNEGVGICITISPNTLVLDGQAGSVSVHSNLAISLVERSTVRLEGITPYLTKADSLGHLVAKFRTDEVKAIVTPGQVTLTLTGRLKDGTSFAASDTITVRQ